MGQYDARSFSTQSTARRASSSSVEIASCISCSNAIIAIDVVTAVALADNQPKHMSHPRVYMNLQEIDGVWQGFRYEDDRIPLMHPEAGPRFASVAAGDVTGDGAPDLHFSDYDDGGPQIFDFNDRLLINDGFVEPPGLVDVEITEAFADDLVGRIVTPAAEPSETDAPEPVGERA